MHDIIDLEARGIPSVFVASEEFASAAVVQSEALGMPDVRWVLVPHPIQDRTDDEMRAIADGAIEDVVKALLA